MTQKKNINSIRHIATAKVLADCRIEVTIRRLDKVVFTGTYSTAIESAVTQSWHDYKACLD